MTAKEILTPLIIKELEKYEENGQKIKLKSTLEKRMTYSITCVTIALLGFIMPLCFVAVPIYFILMKKTKDNVNAIFLLARKNPDKSIKQIIEEEVKV